MDRHALRLLLSQKRAMVSPQTWGFDPPAGQGRRAAGLSQEQMDVLLCRATGTYNRFERGLLASVTPEFLERVAGILGFDEREWAALWLYALGHQPPRPLHSEQAMRIGEHWQPTVDEINCMAYVADAAWQVAAANAHFHALFPGGRAPANVMRWMVLSREARTRCLEDWETVWAPVLLAQLRAAHSQFPDFEPMRRLHEEVLADPVTGPMYQSPRQAYVQPDGDAHRLWHAGLRQSGQLLVSTATPTGSPGARLGIMRFIPDQPGLAPVSS